MRDDGMFMHVPISLQLRFVTSTTPQLSHNRKSQEI